MSRFEETIDDIQNRFLANPEEVSLLTALGIEAGNLIKQNIDEINWRSLLDLKNYFKTKFDNIKCKKITLEKLHAQDRSRWLTRSNN